MQRSLRSSGAAGGFWTSGLREAPDSLSLSFPICKVRTAALSLPAAQSCARTTARVLPNSVVLWGCISITRGLVRNPYCRTPLQSYKIRRSKSGHSNLGFNLQSLRGPLRDESRGLSTTISCASGHDLKVAQGSPASRQPGFALVEDRGWGLDMGREFEDSHVP